MQNTLQQHSTPTKKTKPTNRATGEQSRKFAMYHTSFQYIFVISLQDMHSSKKDRRRKEIQAGPPVGEKMKGSGGEALPHGGARANQ